MILLCHQRSGSEWFLSSMRNVKYGHAELLCGLSLVTGEKSLFDGISLKAKINMLKHMPENVAHKIFISNMIRLRNDDSYSQLCETLRQRSDLYFLERRNVRETIISFAIAVANDMNFHGGVANISKSFRLRKNHIEFLFAMLYTDGQMLRKDFEFKEGFVYEDLLSGAQIPTSIELVPSKSTIKIRGSKNFLSLIENIDEVRTWMDELQIPGQV